MAGRLSLSLVAVGAVLLAGLAFGQVGQVGEEGELARRAHRLARDVMSPFCPGRTLADCPSPDAAAVREQVRQALAEGADEEAIRSELGERYGEVIVGVPRGAAGWGAPVVLLAGGALILVIVLRRVSGGGNGEPVGPDPDPDADLEDELERELRARGL